MDSTSRVPLAPREMRGVSAAPASAPARTRQRQVRVVPEIRGNLLLAAATPEAQKRVGTTDIGEDNITGSPTDRRQRARNTIADTDTNAVGRATEGTR